jgi:polyisoprenoid-binding protein YceI
MPDRIARPALRTFRKPFGSARIQGMAIYNLRTLTARTFRRCLATPVAVAPLLRFSRVSHPLSPPPRDFTSDQRLIGDRSFSSDIEASAQRLPFAVALPRSFFDSRLLVKLRHHRPFLAIVFFTSLLFSPRLRAQETVVTLDPAQTQIEYTLGATLHSVHGTFKLKSGVVHFDPATGKASGAIVVDATSGNSGNDGRDSNMHRQVLESQKYPEIVFTPVQVKGTLNAQGPSQLEVSGTFRLHGQDHTFTLPLSVELAGSQATASTHFSVPYHNWGLKNPSTFILRVKDTVDLDIHTTGHLAPAAGK